MRFVYKFLSYHTETHKDRLPSLAEFGLVIKVN